MLMQTIPGIETLSLTVRHSRRRASYRRIWIGFHSCREGKSIILLCSFRLKKISINKAPPFSLPLWPAYMRSRQSGRPWRVVLKTYHPPLLKGPPQPPPKPPSCRSKVWHWGTNTNSRAKTFLSGQRFVKVPLRGEHAILLPLLPAHLLQVPGTLADSLSSSKLSLSSRSFCYSFVTPFMI
jgi:hypothetical protein